MNETTCQNRTILLVEDERPIRKLLATVLRKRGFIVLEAAGPHNAHELWRDHSASIGVLLTDVVMPGLSGPELALAFLQTRPELNVIFSTGKNQSIIAETLDLIKPKAFLQKPFTPQQLLETVSLAISHRSCRLSQTEVASN